MSEGCRSGSRRSPSNLWTYGPAESRATTEGKLRLESPMSMDLIMNLVKGRKPPVVIPGPWTYEPAVRWETTKDNPPHPWTYGTVAGRETNGGSPPGPWTYGPVVGRATTGGNPPGPWTCYRSGIHGGHPPRPMDL